MIALFGLIGEWAQSVIPVSWQVANTGVAWGDTHLAMIGAGVLGGFAGLYYWFPKITGRLLGESLGKASFALISDRRRRLHRPDPARRPRGDAGRRRQSTSATPG